MSFGGHVGSSSDCATRPRAAEIGSNDYVAPDQRSLPIGPMPWQRPSIGSRVTREGHARFWERLEVKLLRATRHLRRSRTRGTKSAQHRIVSDKLVMRP